MFNPLLTPRDWQMRAQLEATRLVGTHEYEAKMVEMRRYKLMADEIDRLEANKMLPSLNDEFTTASLESVKANRKSGGAELPE